MNAAAIALFGIVLGAARVAAQEGPAEANEHPPRAVEEDVPAEAEGTELAVPEAVEEEEEEEGAPAPEAVGADDADDADIAEADSPPAAPGPSWDAWAFAAGVGIVAHENTAGVFVPLPGFGLSLDRWITPWIGARVAYGLFLARRGVAGTWTLQLQHDASAQVLLRAVVHERCALWIGVGPSLLVRQNGHHAPANSVWSTTFAPAFAASAGVDATLPGFGVRFVVDARIHPDFVDAGGGAYGVVPFQ